MLKLQAAIQTKPGSVAAIFGMEELNEVLVVIKQP